MRITRTFTLFALLAFAGLAPFAPAAPGPTIDTVAGSGDRDNNGDAGPAKQTNIGNPFGVEFGPDGALYICEVDHHRVRRLDPRTGKLTTVAGNGTKGYSGDGGPATKASLNEPYEVRFDKHGDMVFVEMRNHLIRKVDMKTGIISTVAGTGQEGYKDGPHDAAQFKQPHSIAIDDKTDTLYVADIGNHRIRAINLDGKPRVVRTVAGTSRRALPEDGSVITDKPMLGPRALFIEGRTMWLALREGHSVWRIDLDSMKIQHVAGTGRKGFNDGPGNEATFNGPKGVAVGPDGAVYIVDTENQAIRKIDPKSGRVTTLAGVGPKGRGFNGDAIDARKAHMGRPHGVCVGKDGAVYVGDSENHRVRVIR